MSKVSGSDIYIYTHTHIYLFKSLIQVKVIHILILRNNILKYFQEEQERGHVASSIECYQKETGASEKEACEFISNMVEDAWKAINRESLGPTDIPFPLLPSTINFARACDVIYKVNNSYTHARKDMINHIKSLLVHPLDI
ncbi:putative beta-farnesene synthase [Helianthus debilis subsp. tardiflorus]